MDIFVGELSLQGYKPLIAQLVAAHTSIVWMLVVFELVTLRIRLGGTMVCLIRVSHHDSSTNGGDTQGAGYEHLGDRIVFCQSKSSQWLSRAVSG